MPYVVDLAADETLRLEVCFQLQVRSKPFVFAITDQALFLPATRLVVTGDPYYFKRVPVAEVQEVRVQRVRPYGFYLLAALMVAFGLALLWSFTLPEARMTPRALGTGMAIFVGGMLLPLAGRGRCRLQIRTADRKRFAWTPPLVVDSPSKRQVAELMDTVLRVAESVGAPVVDERVR